jgi:Trp operon repressor
MSVENEYDRFLTIIKQTMPQVETNFLLKIMYLERALPDVSPRVEMHVEYKEGVNVERKQEIVRQRYGLPVQPVDEGLIADGQINVGMIEEFCQDSDIKHISGQATPASY